MRTMNYLQSIRALALATLVCGLAMSQTSAESNVFCQRKNAECVNSCPPGPPIPGSGRHSPECVDRCQLEETICNDTRGTHGGITGTSEADKKRK